MELRNPAVKAVQKKMPMAGAFLHLSIYLFLVFGFVAMQLGTQSPRGRME
jgi:hypothetical protein